MGAQVIGGTFLKNELALTSMAHCFEYECTLLSNLTNGEDCLDKITCYYATTYFCENPQYSY